MKLFKAYIRHWSHFVCFLLLNIHAVIWDITIGFLKILCRELSLFVGWIYHKVKKIPNFPQKYYIFYSEEKIDKIRKQLKKAKEEAHAKI